VTALAPFAGLPADPAPAPDWPAITTDDLHYIRAILRTNHPGAIDSLNPTFREWHERGFEQALTRAARARDYPGYFFSIQFYMNGFQDGHLGALDRDERLPYRWPGFTVGYRDGAFVVKETTGADGPATGDRLVSCDGRPADEWAQAIIGDYVGLWSVRGARPRYAPYLLVDEGNPFVRPPRECSFESARGSAKYVLDWQPIAFADLNARIDAARTEFQPPFDLREFGNGGWWISLPSFDANSAETVAALTHLIADIETRADTLRAAPLLVFDVRGNGGGDSSYGERVAATIWGDDYVQSVVPRSEGVDWRVSDENIRALKGFLERTKEQFGADAEVVRTRAAVIAGMERAKAAGLDYYREAVPAGPTTASTNPVRGRVYFLTDYACFSACLDFADLMRSIPGVVHVGEETSADAIYIDNNALRLPSGNGWVGYSMKVHRGRIRGNNESYVPALRWTGSMENTGALEDWIAKLAADAR
jgi:hypothetical protein